MLIKVSSYFTREEKRPRKLMEEICTCVGLGDAVVVDGCKDGSNEPGALEFDWLEVQLDSFRERGMQVSRSTLIIRKR